MKVSTATSALKQGRTLHLFGSSDESFPMNESLRELRSYFSSIEIKVNNLSIWKVDCVKHSLIHVPEGSVIHDVQALFYYLRCKGCVGGYHMFLMKC